MSRRDQFKRSENPATVVIEWAGSGSDGFFKFWNKETKQDVRIDSIRFAVLGERNCVKGWLEEKKSNAYSNEVASLKNQTITVKYFQDGKARELCSGKYDELHDQLLSQGIKYHKVIYAVVLDCEQIETGTIVKIMLKGAASGSWMNFKDKQDSVVCSGFTDGKKGAVKFRIPKFEKSPMDENENEEAELAYEQVSAYFRSVPHTTVEDDKVPHEVIDAQEELVSDYDKSGIPF